MKIFTVVRTEETWSKPATTEIDRSFVSVRDANALMLKRIIESVETRGDMSYALFYDLNHEDLRQDIIDEIGETEATLLFAGARDMIKLPDSIRGIVEDYIKKEVEGTGCYYMCCADGDQEEFHFEVIENELEGI